MAVFSERRARFYLEAYPRLLHQLDRLVEAVRRDDPNIASIVLFGATVRLHPRPTSSADLLFSVRDVHNFLFAPACPLADMPVLSGCTGVQLVRGLQRVPGDGWQLSGVVSDLEGTDLGPAMLDHIARQGTLLYADGNTPLAHPLRGLHDATRWRAEVQALLARCRNIVAEDKRIDQHQPQAQHDQTPLARSVVWDLDLSESIEPEPRA